MKVYLFDTGDSSVGIWPLKWTIDLGQEVKVLDSERAIIRDNFIELLKTLDYIPPYTVFFEDECLSCGSRLIFDGTCSKGCNEPPQEGGD